MSYVIKKASDLKDPFLCYCIFQRFDVEAGEDFIDQNESIVRPFPFYTWMLGKGYITPEQADGLCAEEGDNPNQIWSMDCIPYSETLFPKTEGCGHYIPTRKIYAMLAEYMSSCDHLRKRLFKCIKDEWYKEIFTIEDSDLIASDDFMERFVKYDDRMEDPAHREPYDFEALSYREQWNMLANMSIADSDSYMEVNAYDKNGYCHSVTIKI